MVSEVARETGLKGGDSRNRKSSPVTEVLFSPCSRRDRSVSVACITSEDHTKREEIIISGARLEDISQLLCAFFHLEILCVPRQKSVKK